MATPATFNEFDVLDAAGSKLPEPDSPTGDAVIAAALNLKSSDLVPTVNLKNGSIELPSKKEDRGNWFSRALGKIDKFLDSANETTKSGGSLISNLFNNKTVNQSTNNSQLNPVARKVYSVFNSIFATSNNELVTPAVDKIRESISTTELNNSKSVTNLSTNSLLNSISKETVANRTSNSLVTDLLTKSNILEKTSSSAVPQSKSLDGLTMTSPLIADLGKTGDVNESGPMANSPTKSEEPKSNKALEDALSQIWFKSANEDSKNSEVNVKSKTLVDSKTVNKMLTPDKTVEKTVAKLGKDLPAAVNNLSTSMTSLNNSPQSSMTTVTNEGNRIDQSTNINNQNQQQRVQETQTQPENKSSDQALMHQNEFYLQAIYAALMSGKVKVKIEHT